MNTYQAALDLYASEPCRNTFEDDLRFVMTNPLGYVLRTPKALLMARPVESKAPDPQAIVSPWFWFPLEACDCWHIHLMIGDIGLALRLMPFRLPLVSFERKNVLRFYKLDRIETLITRNPRHR